MKLRQTAAMLGLTVAIGTALTPANATVVPAASVGINFDTADVTYSLSNDTLTIGNGASTPSGGTGVLSNVVTINDPDTIDFSQTVGYHKTESLPSFATITTSDNGTFDFDATMVETTYLVNNDPVNGDGLGLYILGYMYGGTAEDSDTLTSIVLYLSGYQGATQTISGTLSNPPAADPYPVDSPSIPAPEPATLSILGCGLAATLFARRRGASAKAFSG